MIKSMLVIVMLPALLWAQIFVGGDRPSSIGGGSGVAGEYIPPEGSDTDPPLGYIEINNDAAQTNNPVVVITNYITDANLMDMCFANSLANWSPWENYRGTKTWELSEGLGEKIVYARFRDLNYNSVIVQDDIILVSGADTTPPQGTFVINNNDPETSSSTVTLYSYITDNETSQENLMMRFSNDGLIYSAWHNYDDNYSWELLPGDGHKMVYAQFMDEGLNTFDISDGINLVGQTQANLFNVMFTHHSMGARLVGNRDPSSGGSGVPGWESSNWQMWVAMDSINITSPETVELFQQDRDDFGSNHNNLMIRDSSNDQYRALDSSGGSVINSGTPPGNYPTVLEKIWDDQHQEYSDFADLRASIVEDQDIVIIKNSYQTTQWWGTSSSSGASNGNANNYYGFRTAGHDPDDGDDDGHDGAESILEYYTAAQQIMLNIADSWARNYQDITFVYLGLAPRSQINANPVYDDEVTQAVADASASYNDWCKTTWVNTQPNIRYWPWFDYLTDVDSNNTLAYGGSVNDSHYSWERGEDIGYELGIYIHNVATASDRGRDSQGNWLENDSYKVWDTDYDLNDPWSGGE